MSSSEGTYLGDEMADKKKKELKALEPEINIVEAGARLSEAMDTAEKFRKSAVDPITGQGLEATWDAEEMIRYAISNGTGDQLADYYDPDLWSKLKRVFKRSYNALFEGGDFYDITPVENYEEGNDYSDEIDADVAKKLLDVHLKRSGFKKFIHEMMYDAMFLDSSFGKIIPNKETKQIKYRTHDKNGKLVVMDKVLTKSNMKLLNLDIHNLYLENMYEEDLQKNNITEVYESTIRALKEKSHLYTNLENVKTGTKINKYGNISDTFRTIPRNELATNSNRTNDNILVAEYWGAMKVGGTFRQVNIVMAGDVVIRTSFNNLWHGGNPYVDFKVERVKNFAYGVSPAKRFLKTQTALNQIYNLFIKNGVRRASGAMIADQHNAPLIRQQVPNGNVKPFQVISGRKPAIGSLKDSIVPIEFPDVSGTCLTLMGKIEDSLEDGTDSTDVMAGKPTGTQLDRSGTTYGAAINESNINIKDLVYEAQDNLVSPSIIKIYSGLQQTLDEDTQIKDIDGNYKRIKPDRIYWMADINVWGGSKWLEKQQKVSKLIRASEFIKGAPNLFDEIDGAEMVEMYYKYEDLPYEKLRKAKTPMEQVIKLMQDGVTPETMLEMALIAVEEKQKLVEAQEMGKQLQAKNAFINEVNVDESFDAANEKVQKKIAGATKL